MTFLAALLLAVERSTVLVRRFRETSLLQGLREARGALVQR
jgi:hypothetical protein